MSGSETGSEDVGPGRAGSGGAGGDGKGGGDLASRTLVLESKRFYLDVKENTRGRFIKMAEISSDGRKNQILMTIPTAAQFRKHLESMITFYQGLEAVDANNLTQGELRSEVIIKEDKKYHVDLKASVPFAILRSNFYPFFHDVSLILQFNFACLFGLHVSPHGSTLEFRATYSFNTSFKT